MVITPTGRPEGVVATLPLPWNGIVAGGPGDDDDDDELPIGDPGEDEEWEDDDYDDDDEEPLQVRRAKALTPAS